MRIIDFKPQHIDFLDACEGNEVDKLSLIPLHTNMTPNCVMKSLIDDGRLVCVMGIREVMPKVGEVYNYRTDYMTAKHVRVIKEALDNEKVFYDRLQTHSIVGAFDKWHKAMGFEQEAVLKKYINGEDRVLWVRL